MRLARRSLFLLATALLATVAAVATATPASAAFHYAQSPKFVIESGVKFIVVTEQDDVTGAIRANGTIDARNTSSPGRIYWISLDRCPPTPGGSCTNIRNYTTEFATNDLAGRFTPSADCSPYGYYYISRLKYHVDGTSITGTLTAPAVFLSC